MPTSELNSNAGFEETSLADLYFKARDWFIYLKRKWLIILLLGMLGAAAGYAYAAMQKPVYVAEMNFTVEDDKGSGGGGLSSALGLASSLGLDLGGGAGNAFSGANLIQLMKSRKLVEQTLLTPVQWQGKTISLADMYIEFTGTRAAWDKANPELGKKLQFPPHADRKNFTLQQDSVLGIISKGISSTGLSVAQKDKKISIITVEVRAKNEAFAKLFAEALVKEVSDFYIETKSKKAKLNVDILERQADSVRRELNGAITGVAVANDNIYNLNSAMNVQRTPSAKRQVDVQANTAILTQLVINLELARVSLRKETPLMQLIDTPILPLKKEKVSKLNSMITGSFLAVFVLLVFLVLKRILPQAPKQQ